MTERAQKFPCKARVVYDNWGHSSPCQKTATNDGWCGIHHPDAIKARQERSAAQYEARANVVRREQAIREARNTIITAAKTWFNHTSDEDFEGGTSQMALELAVRNLLKLET